MLKRQLADGLGDAFKVRALNFKPELGRLTIDDQQWFDIARQFQKENRQSLNNSFLLRAISDTTEQAYDDLLDLLAIKKQPQRQAKDLSADIAKPQTRTYKKRRKDTRPASLVSDDPDLYQSLAHLGIKHRELNPATPGRSGYSQPFRSPGDTLYHGLFSRNGSTLYDKATPDKLKTQISPSKERDKPKGLYYERPEPIKFTATKAKLESRKGAKRSASQRSLTGGSCKEVFVASGDKNAVTMKGNHFHWSHLIAHFLGGPQNARNIVPGTAISNYNTLHIIEEFIAEKLYVDGCDFIETEVTPYYTDNSLIPSELIFELSWQEMDASNKLKDQMELIYINPRSYKDISSKNRECINALRQQNIGENTDENDPDPNRIKP